jgi:glycosyltransferase family protein
MYKPQFLQYAYLLVKNMKYELSLGENYPIVIKPLQTLKIIKDQNKSIARFGDGEFSIMQGNSIGFQLYDQFLASRLEEILISNDSQILIGIPDVFASLTKFKPKSKLFWRTYLAKNRVTIIRMLDLQKTYYDAMITRPYANIAVKYEESTVVFDQWKTIWKDREIFIIEGENNLFGKGNDLFSTAKIKERLKVPSKDAFRMYDSILNRALKESINELILISLGPTATVLAYDLAHLGYQAIDVGHLDDEYRDYLRKDKQL